MATGAVNNEKLYEAAAAAIRNVFNDRSVSARTCAINLRTLAGEIAIMLDALKLDIEEEERR